MIEYKDFTSYDGAQSFCEAREAEGHPYVSILTNTPHPGSWRVSWGTRQIDASFDGLMREYANIFDAREQNAQAQYTQQCEALGRLMAAGEAADESGLSGRDAEVFISGFKGVPAKTANPRAEGREHLFRAGRRAWGEPRWQRAYRAASVRARSMIEFDTTIQFREGGLIANGEHD